MQIVFYSFLNPNANFSEFGTTDDSTIKDQHFIAKIRSIEIMSLEMTLNFFDVP